MSDKRNKRVVEFLDKCTDEIERSIFVDKKLYTEFDVKRGLRNSDGSGVMAGVTRIGNVRGYYIQDGEKTPMEGQLIYRGIDVNDLVTGFIQEDRFGFEETAYLLLFGHLPDRETLADFNEILAEYRYLPDNFTEDMILAAPSNDIMNKLARAVLALYSYDPDPEPEHKNIHKELAQALHLIARCPVIVANAFAAKKHYFDNESLYIHWPKDDLSTAENFLYSARHDNNFTKDEAQLLDLCLVLHAEHGGGNNSALFLPCFIVIRDGYLFEYFGGGWAHLKATVTAALTKESWKCLSSLNGTYPDWKDDEEVLSYLRKILRKEAGNGEGLIYGFGHAVYTLSDPRAVRLKEMAKKLAGQKGMLEELELFEKVERLAPIAMAEERGIAKAMCANVDMYSGLVYKMLDIPYELYTPLFAIARMVGWCAHRIEEVFNNNRIMRPAYKAITPKKDYIPLADR